MQAVERCRQRVFKELWKHYYGQVDYASMIEQYVKSKSDQWVEDHVAYRTLPGQHTGMHILERLFSMLGYKREDDYDFAEKHLQAFWMSPNDTDGSSEAASPKIFISEIRAGEFGADFEKTILNITSEVQQSAIERLEAMYSQIDDPKIEDAFVQTAVSMLTEGPSWSRPKWDVYQTLAKLSEYAAWTYLFGNQLNHFTVSVHLMKSLSDIVSLGESIEKDLSIPMNKSGGMVKGTADVKLEQIATMAAKVQYQFQDGVREVSYGFVEFAKRYPLEGKSDDHQWSSYYQGFVAANANKIFESTDMAVDA